MTSLKRSYFAAKFVATPANAIYTIHVGDNVTLAEWSVEEMHQFLRGQRQWDDWILRDDKMCRMFVAVFWTAYDRTLGAMAASAPSCRAPPPVLTMCPSLWCAPVRADKTLEDVPNPIDLMPYAGPHRPLSITTSHDWIAPHLMNQLAGILKEYDYVPDKQARVLNALVDPFKNRRLALHVAFVIFLNAIMWLMFAIDALYEIIPTEETSADTELDDDDGGSEAVGNFTNATNFTEYDIYPPAPPPPPPPEPTFMPLKSHGVRPRTLEGLEGVASMPFLHADINHIALNTGGFLIFGIAIVLKHGMKVFCMLSLWLWLFSGCARRTRVRRSMRSTDPRLTRSQSARGSSAARALIISARPASSSATLATFSSWACSSSSGAPPAVATAAAPGIQCRTWSSLSSSRASTAACSTVSSARRIRKCRGRHT